MNQRRNVAILLFDEVEVLDFAGPFEVFSIMGQRDGPGAFNVYTVAQERRPILARNQLSVNPQCTFEDCPKPDVLIVPGGYGTRPLMNDEATVRWSVSELKAWLAAGCPRIEEWSRIKGRRDDPLRDQRYRRVW